MVGLEALRKSDLFEGLSDDELAAIAKMAREETYEVGRIIFKENDVREGPLHHPRGPGRDLDRYRPGQADRDRHDMPQRLFRLVGDGTTVYL